MRASLDSTLLLSMLSRGGWSSSAESDLKRNQGKDIPRSATILQSKEWLLSRCLSHQCSLASGWTGNGVDARPAIVESSEIDFTELTNGYSTTHGNESTGLIFSTSVCGHFLLIARDTLVYIYDLRSGFLVPTTSVVCPRRVLSMSMDVSCGRHAVAALLEGRMGMVCELRHGDPTGHDSPVEVHIDSHEYTSESTTTALFLTSEERHSGSFSAIDVRSNIEDIIIQGTNDHRRYEQNLINPTWNLHLHGLPPDQGAPGGSKVDARSRSIPIENGTSTFYRHLCSDDDPPRSVSICPQRLCVAFGCSAGIELHWIDAMTSQSLSRWFPLTAPSDHLFFLAPRLGFESAKKLRLISSAAHPHDRPSIRRRFFLSRPKISSFWGSFGFESISRGTGSPSCDHYHAVPLSDGHHVLFVEPASGKLALGCDAPLGGPTKLLRKAIFFPPEENVVPRLYTAAADLAWGARVVVVYGDTIMLYSIPPDMITLSQLEQKAESSDIYTVPPLSYEGRAKNHWLNWLDEPYCSMPTSSSDTYYTNPIWPITIRGTEIGKLSSVCEVSIQTRPDILIWAFTHSAQCKTWRLRNYVDPVIYTKQYVCRDGIVHDDCAVDETGDVIMADALPPTPAPSAVTLRVAGDADEYFRTERSVIVGFDGNASGVLKRIPKALAVENDDWVDLVDVRDCSDAWYDADGDVVMFYRT
jgi:hypothetical protein